jgi:hypothetical protein
MSSSSGGELLHGQLLCKVPPPTPQSREHGKGAGIPSLGHMVNRHGSGAERRAMHNTACTAGSASPETYLPPPSALQRWTACGRVGQPTCSRLSSSCSLIQLVQTWWAAGGWIVGLAGMQPL